MSLRTERRAAGLCPQCGCEPENGTYCETCKEARRRQYRSRRDERSQSNQCYVCRQSVLEGQRGGKTPLCRKCYLKRIAKRTTGSVKNWRLLDRLWESQGGVCPYSGLQLELGKNADLDHIRPVAKYPERKGDPDNWQWVHEDVNKMKWSMEENSFLRMIELIYLNRSEG